jgi:uncharacterized protein YukE
MPKHFSTQCVDSARYLTTIDTSGLQDYALSAWTAFRLDSWEVLLFAGQTGKSTVELVAAPSVKQQTTAIQLWHKTNSQLEKALGYYDKLDAESLADKTRIIQPKTWFGQSKASYQQEIDQIIDAVLRVLEASGAAECRDEIKKLQQAVKESHQRIAGHREQLVSARPRASLSFPESVWAKSVEDLKKSITAEERKIDDLRQQIGQLKERFRSQLQQIGIEVFDDEIDYLLMPVTQDDFVSMAAVVANIAALTAQLEHLVGETRELPAHSRRYYGMYLLLVYSIDRVQTRFIQEIDHVHLPKLGAFEQEARQNIADAKNQIAGGGPKEQLKANVEAAELTIEACRSLASVLRDQKNAIACENRQTQLMLDAAVNTYKTIRLSMNVAELMSDCREAFGALRQLRLPRLRTFQNLQLKGELQRLTERMREGEKS